MNKIKGQRVNILIFGITFKGLPETIDIRNSPSINLEKILNKKHRCEFYDVKGKEITKVHKIKNVLLNLNNIKKYDIIIFANNNIKYQDLFLKNITINNTSKRKLFLTQHQF